jgi:hypothetical protein
VSRSHLANDSGHFGPQTGASAVDAGSASGCADVLARESARDDIHHSTPRAAVEGSDVVPDWEGGEASVVLPSDEHAASVIVDLDSADGSPPEQLSAEYAASSACE